MFAWCVMLLFLGIITPFSQSMNSKDSDTYTIPDYDFYLSKKPDLRSRLTEKFALRKQSDEKIRKLKASFTKDIEYYDDIPHHKLGNTTKLQRKASEFGNELNKIIAMVGVKYIYKRNMYWRTWREVKHRNASKEVVCYRCENTINCNHTNCTDCHHGGYWAIEDSAPSCSYEILSFKSATELCVVNFWDINNSSSCPNTVTYQELSHCYFPMITKLRITIDYSQNVSKRNITVICHGREVCEFSTFYKVNPDIIVLRIINSSNDIVYSRLMKNNGINYVCIENCGHIDFETGKVTKSEDHLVLNLLEEYSQKKKRENTLHSGRESTYYSDSKFYENVKSKPKTVFKHNLLPKRHKHVIEQPLDRQEYFSKTSTLSYCKRIILNELANN